MCFRYESGRRAQVRKIGNADGNRAGRAVVPRCLSSSGPIFVRVRVRCRAPRSSKIDGRVSSAHLSLASVALERETPRRAAVGAVGAARAFAADRAVAAWVLDAGALGKARDRDDADEAGGTGLALARNFTARGDCEVPEAVGSAGRRADADVGAVHIRARGVGVVAGGVMGWDGVRAHDRIGAVVAIAIVATFGGGVPAGEREREQSDGPKSTGGHACSLGGRRGTVHGRLARPVFPVHHG
jgi:hypothetical protein